MLSRNDNGGTDVGGAPVLFDHITGAVLAGGQSTRMGRNKALIEVDGVPLVQRVFNSLQSLFPQTILVTNTPDTYSFINCKKVPDSFVGHGSLAGIHAALLGASTDKVFVSACDMPFLSQHVMAYISRLSGDAEIIVPESPNGLEPLLAIYSKSCLAAIGEMLAGSRRKILWLYDQCPTKIVPWSEISSLPGAERCFLNLNSPADLSTACQNPPP